MATIAHASSFAPLAGLGLAGWGIAHAAVPSGATLAGLLALEAALLATDTFAFSAAAGEASSELRRASWVRSVAAAFAARTLVPFGRPLGEIVRATLLARDLGARRAAQVVGHFLVAVLAADVAAALVLAASVNGREDLASIASETSVGHAASGALVAAAVLGGALAVTLFVLVRWIVPEAPPRGASIATAAARSSLGALVRTAQCALVLHGAGESASLDDALTVQSLAATSSAPLARVLAPGAEMASVASALHVVALVLAAACLGALLVAKVARSS